jgi:RNA-directed DNA polymerase
VTRIKKKVKAWLSRAIHWPWELVIDKLNQVLRGWTNYFSYGSVTKAYRDIDRYVYDRALATLVRKHGREGRGKGQWSGEVLYSQNGLRHLKDLKPTPRA